MSKAARTILAVLACVLSGSGALAQSGGGYDVHWNTLAAGGATMSGKSYTLTGTVAQQSASATCASGASGHALRDGFWTGVPGGDVVFRGGFEAMC